MTRPTASGLKKPQIDEGCSGSSGSPYELGREMLRESARECNFFAITRGQSLPERHPNSRNCKTGRSRRTRRQNLPWRYGDWRRIEKQSWMNPVTQGAVDLPHLLVRQEAEKSRAHRKRYSREMAIEPSEMAHLHWTAIRRRVKTMQWKSPLS